MREAFKTRANFGHVVVCTQAFPLSAAHTHTGLITQIRFSFCKCPYSSHPGKFNMFLGLLSETARPCGMADIFVFVEVVFAFRTSAQ